MSDVEQTASYSNCILQQHELVSQGSNSWDWGNMVDQGEQVLCRTCGVLYLKIEETKTK